jgi:hypothetical protein
MQINVKIDMFPGKSPSKTITLAVADSTTVNAVQLMIEKQEQIPQMNQYLVLNMQEIMGNRSLKDLGIENGTELLLTSGDGFRRLQIVENRKKKVANTFKS